MNKAQAKTIKGSFEGKALVVLSALLIGVIGTAWTYAMNLRQTVATNNAVVNVDPAALIAVEKLRNLADSQIDNSRSFFLLGSKSLFDKQKKDKEDLAEALASFEKQFHLPQVPEILKRVQSAMQQQQEIFDQGMEFREKQTESKIVGQFYQSKSGTVRNQINEALDDIVKIHKAELDRTRKEAKEAAINVETQIPKGMVWFTSAVAGLFFMLALLVVKMIRERQAKLQERERLYNEAKKAVLSRDEVLAAVSQDLNEPLNEIKTIADDLVNSPDLMESAELITSTVAKVETLIRDIGDQKNADMGSLPLRLDQLNVDEVLDDARLILQPMAKKRDIRLQFDSGNPPALAFFDRERVIRILYNLVGNAIKFSPKHSKVTVKVRSDQQFVSISVIDAGPTIPEGQQDKIFDNFWQSRKTADQGAGVGLAVVKTIVEAHEGTIKVERAGNGNAFTFTLPRRRPVGAQLRKPAPPTVRISRPKGGNEPQMFN